MLHTTDFTCVGSFVIMDEVKMSLERPLMFILEVTQVTLEHGFHAVGLEMLVQFRLYRKNLATKWTRANILLQVKKYCTSIKGTNISVAYFPFVLMLVIVK